MMYLIHIFVCINNIILLINWEDYFSGFPFQHPHASQTQTLADMASANSC